MADGMHDTPGVTREDRGGVATLTLRRPAARNSLSRALMAELAAALAAVTAEPEARVVVLAAEGPAFCAGHDLTRDHRPPRRCRCRGRLLHRRHGGLRRAHAGGGAPPPAGDRGGGGAWRRRRAASSSPPATWRWRGAAARFCTPGVDIGLFCSTPAVALARAVPRKAAMEMLLTGGMIDAEAAQRIGLVNRVVPQGEALAAAQALADGIAARSARAVQLGKRGFLAQVEAPLDEAYRRAAAVMVENMLAADAAEGIGAFLEKRPPVWQHR